MLIRLSRSKGDPGRKGATVAVPYSTRIGSCPVRSTMLLARTQKTGPLYRKIDRHGRQLARLTPEAVNTIVRRHVAAVLGVDPALYSSHSLRAGWVTEARSNGVPAQDIMRHTRHTDARMLHVYDRPTDLLEAHPMRGVTVPARLLRDRDVDFWPSTPERVPRGQSSETSRSCAGVCGERWAGRCSGVLGPSRNTVGRDVCSDRENEHAAGEEAVGQNCGGGSVRPGVCDGEEGARERRPRTGVL